MPAQKKPKHKHKMIRYSEFPKLNPIRQIQRIEDYRGYKLILYLPIVTALDMTHFGYLDRDFFAFQKKKQTPTDKTSFLFSTATDAIDYYIDKLYFKNPQLEYDTFANINKYKSYVNSLRLVYDSIYNNKKNSYLNSTNSLIDW